MEHELNQQINHHRMRMRVSDCRHSRWRMFRIREQDYVMQFHGFWHDCPTCFWINRDRKLNSFTDHSNMLDTHYEQTLAATWRFSWKYSDNKELTSRSARCIFWRLNGEYSITRCDIARTEKIHYVNVCSLYPYVQKRVLFGFPKIYIGEECSELIGAASFWFQLDRRTHCKVFPLRDLFHPVLPYRIRGKLLFVHCCKTFSQAEYTHRMWIRGYLSILRITQSRQERLSHIGSEWNLAIQGHAIWSRYATGWIVYWVYQ